MEGVNKLADDRMHVAFVPVSPYAKTGYGKQIRGIVKHLPEERFRITCVGGGEAPTWGASREVETEFGKVSFLNVSGDPHGSDVMPVYEQVHDFDVVVSLLDAFELEYMQELETTTATYLPIDSESFHRCDKWYGKVMGNDYIIAYSRFGFQELLKSPIRNSKCKYIPHAIDTEKFRPKKEHPDVMEKLERDPGDSFTFLHVGANVSSERKRIHQLMYAFKEFLEEVESDAKLIIFTDPTVSFPNGADYNEFRGRLGLETDVIFPRLAPRLSPWTDGEMAALYSMSDVYISASEAEGFGLPLVEACACGIPIIAPENSAQTEHVEGSGGFPVETCDDFWNYPKYTPFGQKNEVPRIPSLVERMEKAYNSNLEKKGKEAREYAENYSWNKIAPKWMDFFDQI